MQDASPTDRRYSQTQDRYAADDLETMQRRGYTPTTSSGWFAGFSGRGSWRSARGSGR